MGGASHIMFCARKQSGMIQATKGWKKLVLATLTTISIVTGANHVSRCGGRVKVDAILPVLEGCGLEGRELWLGCGRILESMSGWLENKSSCARDNFYHSVCYLSYHRSKIG